MLLGFVRSAAIAAVLLCGACSSGGVQTQSAPQNAHPFTLTNQYGKSVTIAGTSGVATALYFGFAHCKDICPQTIARLGRARESAQLQPAQLRIVMVTVDPSHDSPAALKAFIDKTHVDAQALTGTLKQLHPVYRAYGVVIASPPPHGDDLTHTDYVYLIDRQGRLVNAVTSRTPLTDVARDLKALVQ